MLSHHQFSKPCESYRHVKDGESRTLAGNTEPQTIWCLWLLLCGHPYMPRGYLYFRREVELNLRAREHLPAGPLQQAADEQLWGDVTLWVSSWQLLPWLWHWGSRQGLLVRHRETELKAAFHHSGGKRKGQEMYLSAFVVWKWQEFFGGKKKIFIFRPEIWPSQKIQAAFWAWRRTVRGVIAVQCLNPHSFAVFFLYCALCNFCGRTWSWDNDNTVSLENASAFYCL